MGQGSSVWNVCGELEFKQEVSLQNNCLNNFPQNLLILTNSTFRIGKIQGQIRSAIDPSCRKRRPWSNMEYSFWCCRSRCRVSLNHCHVIANSFSLSHCRSSWKCQSSSCIMVWEVPSRYTSTWWSHSIVLCGAKSTRSCGVSFESINRQCSRWCESNCTTWGFSGKKYNPVTNPIPLCIVLANSHEFSFC